MRSCVLNKDNNRKAGSSIISCFNTNRLFSAQETPKNNKHKNNTQKPGLTPLFITDRKSKTKLTHPSNQFNSINKPQKEPFIQQQNIFS